MMCIGYYIFEKKKNTRCQTLRRSACHKNGMYCVYYLED